MPHGTCYLWNPGVLWLNVISDALICLAYYAIPILLVAFFRQRRDLTFRWVFVAFATFILACGTTHAMGVWTVWHPTYRLDGIIKAITAIASFATAILLVPLLPGLVQLPSPSTLTALNKALAAEVEERKTLSAMLERRVGERTAELQQTADILARTNHELRQEIDRRMQLEDQLLQSQKMEAIGRLAGGIAHDFNNLLTVISGYNAMVAEETTSLPGTSVYVHEIGKAADRTAALTNQLLAFSRRQMTQPRIINLNHSVLHMEHLLGRLIGEDIRLTTHLDSALPMVEADPAQIEQVIMNLVVNARDAMPDGGELSIATRCVELNEDDVATHAGIGAGSYVQLSIADTGHGMNEATRVRIFEPFFTTKEIGKGTGLGLSIVYGIVKQNFGEISVSSQEGKGSTFTIYLPVASAAPEAEELSPAIAQPLRGSETVLVVEDEDAVRRLVHAMLTKRGYVVLECSDGPAAVELCRRHQGAIHILLTDVVMPEMSGPELAKRLAPLHPEMKVLYMSGYADNEVARRAVLQEDSAFIQKPFTVDTLQEKLRSVLRVDTV